MSRILKNVDAVRSESEPAWWEGPMRITWSHTCIATKKNFEMRTSCELYGFLGQREGTYSKVVSDLL